MIKLYPTIIILLTSTLSSQHLAVRHTRSFLLTNNYDTINIFDNMLKTHFIYPYSEPYLLQAIEVKDNRLLINHDP
ncbi:hypothetical protein DOS78_03150 [Staphylococcus felis]|uniref:hypothetical protein n=1 Tax=Staphylococcus felis TaxID=46127 RepID=UPI000E27CBF9|nr:hypothetical protein [Staphylococcus felis]REH99608.1 hypothetical protein DOS65_11270 [Staphylococcus felis]REI06963.1 hypothetical protein DOS66_11420 [Staphylococcus felis]REI25295.1 hypothetical protein DOS78_03150 [Staphylococcus felis]